MPCRDDGSGTGIGRRTGSAAELEIPFRQGRYRSKMGGQAGVVWCRRLIYRNITPPRGPERLTARRYYTDMHAFTFLSHIIRPTISIHAMHTSRSFLARPFLHVVRGSVRTRVVPRLITRPLKNENIRPTLHVIYDMRDVAHAFRSSPLSATI